MAEIVRTQRRSELRCLAELGNDLPDAAFRQRSTLAKKEMPIWPPAPGSNRIPIDSCPLTPAFCQVFAVVEINIEWFACFLDERDLTMFESLATSNDEQPAPGSDLDIGNLERSHFGDAWACIAEQGSESQGQSVIAANELLCTPPYRVPIGL